MDHGEFRDPRLVPLYDAEYGWGRDDDFFVSVIGVTPAARVLDVGCGTGRVTLGLAAAGHRVTGVDPARASLDVARAKPGADRVTWLEGGAEVAPSGAFDAALMTAHVAQFVVGDDAWSRLLADLHRALVPGGRLVFDTRDPAARAWEAWNPADTRRTVRLGEVEVVEWTEVTAVEGGLVSFTHHYEFPGGDHLLGSATMRFRGEGELRTTLADAGFTVDAIHGGWGREPIGAPDGEFLVLAHRGRG